MNMVIWELRSKQALFSKWLPRPNHYAHWIRIEILSKTPVSILRDLPQTPGKRLIIVSQPECRPEFPRDDDGDSGGDGGFPRTLPIWSCPGSITRRDQISRAGNPSLRPLKTTQAKQLPYGTDKVKRSRQPHAFFKRRFRYRSQLAGCYEQCRSCSLGKMSSHL